MRTIKLTEREVRVVIEALSIALSGDMSEGDWEGSKCKPEDANNVLAKLLPSVDSDTP